MPKQIDVIPMRDPQVMIDGKEVTVVPGSAHMTMVRDVDGLTDDDLDTILAIARNRQSGRVTEWELQLLVAAYRTLRAHRNEEEADMRTHEVKWGYKPLSFWRRVWCRIAHRRFHVEKPGYHSYWCGCMKCGREWLELD